MKPFLCYDNKSLVTIFLNLISLIFEDSYPETLYKVIVYNLRDSPKNTTQTFRAGKRFNYHIGSKYKHIKKG
jgi:hypothetical protein